ncbi:MAG: Eco57I restriction-modification methylase domain-containing protein [Spirochaetaceae bacterium]|jgi:hypothetical protein|nr:Eco57I restriction-modification methylase domain-containing protein [Spirochaetaceae bacterium]
MDKLSKLRFSELVNKFELSVLFNILGWDSFQTTNRIDVKGSKYTISGIAQKKDFCVLECVVDKIPDAAIRKQFEKPLTRLYFDHLLVFINKNKTAQFWQLPLRDEGKLKRLVSFAWHKGQDPEGLYQKFRNIVFTLDEEENITLLDVKERVTTSLSANSEKVVKRFYTEFSKQHEAFLAFIKGIDDALPDKDNFNKKWYASLMMNRLMFCYFIQKKRFLDWNDNYLQDKLKECKKLKGTGNFYGFYRSFLLELFHDELANPAEKRRQKKIPVEFGDIPYLNGGLFEVHYLEETYKDIAVPDEAFQNIFDFFDEWNWHLDTRITASGKDINPDVIGYIFEKYINNRADMGAYYTKEDITDYIGKNTIIPFLLEKVKTYHSAPFAPGGGFWQYLQDSGDEYIYDAVKKGAGGGGGIDEIDIPENIKTGIDTKKPNLLERRKYWNTATPEETGLPTEIWRETIARLERYFELKRKIEKGTIAEINDLITWNLNIRRLVQDYLEQTADKEFVRKFYKALISITILDPTCGSGAFLFAALNILEPLYEVCLQRMEEFYNENPKGNKDFEDRLQPLLNGEHPSRAYYIFKTIILNNLYGVDLMKEAVEIAKLRLFLKLAAEVDPSRRKKNFGLEPLPDIDFNIRSGNTLVGFATEKQLEEVVKNTEGDLIYEERVAELKSACEIASASFTHFRQMQMVVSSDSAIIRRAKHDYANAIIRLDEKLNRYLADTYGLGTNTQWKSQNEKEQAYRDWKDSHQPFHWFAEFYEIISKGGFDVVIGNPPYVEIRNIGYKIKNYQTESCGNLYAFIIERALSILNRNSNIGMIIPISSVTNNKFQVLQNIFSSKTLSWFSSYSNRPAKLFENVEQRLTIFIGKKYENIKSEYYTCSYKHWHSKTREYLFSTILYCANNYIKSDLCFSKIGNTIEMEISKKLKQNSSQKIVDFVMKSSRCFTYYHNGPTYFIRAMSFMPNSGKNMQASSHYKCVNIKKDLLNIIPCVLNSSLFYFFFKNYSNCRDFSEREIYHFPIGKLSEETINILGIFEKELKKNYIENKEIKKRNYESGLIYYEEYYPAKSKPIIDEIDKVLAKHYSFTEEELDFIINYDIKYRMGGELEGEE